jgi:hypothetical protein
MELNGHKRKVFMPDSFVGVVVDIREPGLPTGGQGFCLDSIPMVLRRDETAFRSFLETGLILTAVTVFKLVGVGTGGQSHQLISEADTECGDFLLKAASDELYGLLAHLGIAWAV